MNAKHDPEKYAAMSIPHESLDSCNDAIRAFYADVEAARERHRIESVVVVVRVNVKADDVVHAPITYAKWGGLSSAAVMLAQALGEEKADLERAIRDAEARGRKMP